MTADAVTEPLDHDLDVNGDDPTAPDWPTPPT